jgi:hypothetical protein
MGVHQTPCISSRAVLVSERPRVCWGLRACTRSSPSHNSHTHWLSSPRPRACTTSQRCCTPRLVGHSLNDAVDPKYLAPHRWTVYRRARHTLSRTPPQEEIAALDTISCIKTSPHFPSWPQMLLACFVRPSNFIMVRSPPLNAPLAAHQTSDLQPAALRTVPTLSRSLISTLLLWGTAESVRAVPTCGYQSA